jgi:hypothetical protein
MGKAKQPADSKDYVRIVIPDIEFTRGIRDEPEFREAIATLNLALDRLSRLEGVEIAGEMEWHSTA